MRPIVEYATVAWSPHANKGIDCIESVQRRAARFANSSLGPGSALVEKGGKKRRARKKIGERSEPSGSLGRERVAPPISPPQTTARLASLANIFPISPLFLPFPNAELGPRLRSK